MFLPDWLYLRHGFVSDPLLSATCGVALHFSSLLLFLKQNAHSEALKKKQWFLHKGAIVLKRAIGEKCGPGAACCNASFHVQRLLAALHTQMLFSTRDYKPSEY